MSNDYTNPKRSLTMLNLTLTVHDYCDCSYGTISGSGSDLQSLRIHIYRAAKKEAKAVFSGVTMSEAP